MRLFAQRPQGRPAAATRTAIAPLWPAMVRQGARFGKPGAILDSFHVTPTRPQPAPQRVSPPQPRPAAPKTFDLPGIRPGMTLQIANGSSYEGYAFNGTASVRAADARTLDLTVNASAMGGFVQKTIHLSFLTQPDGTVRALSDTGPTSTALSVVSERPGQTILQAPDGSQVTVLRNGGGGLTLTYGQNRIVLTR